MSLTQQLAADNATQARVYLDFAARGLGPDYGSDETTRFVADLEMLHPASYLVAHAAELALIAYLQIEGIGTTGGNHELWGRLEAAKAGGLHVLPQFEQYVGIIAPAHGAAQFRYAKSEQHGFVRPRKAIDLVRPQVEAIHDHVMGRIFASTAP